MRNSPTAPTRRQRVGRPRKRLALFSDANRGEDVSRIAKRARLQSVPRPSPTTRQRSAPYRDCITLLLSYINIIWRYHKVGRRGGRGGGGGGGGSEANGGGSKLRSKEEKRKAAESLVRAKESERARRRRERRRWWGRTRIFDFEWTKAISRLKNAAVKETRENVVGKLGR